MSTVLSTIGHHRITKCRKFKEATIRMMCVKNVRVKDAKDGFLYSSHTADSIKNLELSEVQQMLYKKSSDWGKEYPEANGKHQSPVDLTSSDAIFDESLLERALSVSYCTSRETDIYNDGQTLIVYPRNRGMETSIRFDMTQRSIISGGPFEPGHEYELAEIRFHWGSCNSLGSEHRVNTKAFPMEIQLIHWNSSLYPTVDEAVGRPHGLAALCVFVQIGKESPAIKTLFNDSLRDVTFKGRQKIISTPFNPSGLLPESEIGEYWTYKGSMTAPPCYENTQWIIFRYPLLLSHSQVDEFRRLRSYSKGDTPIGGDGRLVDNFRPIQPLNMRKIRASFQ